MTLIICVNTDLPVSRSLFTHTSILNVSLQSQSFCGFALTAPCPSLLLLCDPVSLGPRAAVLHRADCTIRCPQNEMACFITIPGGSCLPGTHIPTKGNTWPSSPRGRVHQWLGRSGKSSVTSRLCSAETLEGKLEVSSQVGQEICQECTLFPLTGTQSGQDTEKCHSLVKKASSGAKSCRVHWAARSLHLLYFF